MKKLTRILSIMFLLLVIATKISSADVIMANENPRNHGMERYENWYENKYENRYNGVTNENRITKRENNNMDTLKVLGIGVLVLIIATCTLYIIVQLVRRGKEKNDNK